MAIFEFGSGVLMGVRTDIANATPVNFGMAQEVTLDLSFNTKELYGQNQFALAVARGTAKFTGKAKLAQISGIAFNSFFFGATPTVGSFTATAYGESHGVPAAASPVVGSSAGSGATTITLTDASNVEAGDQLTGTGLPADAFVTAVSGDTVTISDATTGAISSGATLSALPKVHVANASEFIRDYGVVYAATGLPLTYVPPNQTVHRGQYTVNSNHTYIFNANDSGTVILISYAYTATSQGQILPVSNQLLGTTPTFAARLFTTFQGKEVSAYLYNCTASKLSFGTKLEDFVVPELSFSIFANAAGNVLDWNFAEAS